MVSRLGSHNLAAELISSNAANHPADLVTAQMREEHEGRTRFLDEGEVQDAAVDLFGKDVLAKDEDDKKKLKPILSARVRGAKGSPDEMQVVLLVEFESGRTGRGAVPYKDFSSSKKAYGKALKDGTVMEGEPDDPAALKLALRQAQEEVARLTRDQSPAEPEAPAPAEPYDGYAEDNAVDVIKQIQSGDLSPEQLTALRAAETDGKERKTVLAALDEAQQPAGT